MPVSLSPNLKYTFTNLPVYGEGVKIKILTLDFSINILLILGKITVES